MNANRRCATTCSLGSCWWQSSLGAVPSYAWDANHRLTGIVNPYGEVTTITPDALGREWWKTLDNAMVVSHSYDAAGRETVLVNLKQDGTALALFTATYDPAGNRLDVRETVNGASAHVSYLYDAADQLTREWRTGANAYDVSYTYDEAGNRLLKSEGGSLTTHTYDEANEPRVTVEPNGTQVTHTWDANGNLIGSVWSGGAEAPEEFQWDDENRLATSSKYGIVIEHDYLPNGLRRYMVATPQPEPDFFVWDGQNLLIERHQGSNLLIPPVRTQYTDFPGVWGGLVSQRRADTSHFYGFDLQGNTRILVDASGAVTDTEVFTAFGERVAVSGNTPHRLRYAGRWGYQAEGLDFVYVRAGWLDPDWGRWIRRDPLWPEDGPNWYLYVGNNPVGSTDPSGLWTRRSLLGGWMVTADPGDKFRVVLVRPGRTRRGQLPIETAVDEVISRLGGVAGQWDCVAINGSFYTPGSVVWGPVSGYAAGGGHITQGVPDPRKQTVNLPGRWYLAAGGSREGGQSHAAMGTGVPPPGRHAAGGLGRLVVNDRGTPRPATPDELAATGFTSQITGTRPRTAVGKLANGRMVFFATRRSVALTRDAPDWGKGTLVPRIAPRTGSSVADELIRQGVQEALFCDGGGSTQMYFNRHQFGVGQNAENGIRNMQFFVLCQRIQGADPH